MKPFITPGISGPAVTSISRPPSRLSPIESHWASVDQDAQGVSATQGGVRRARDVARGTKPKGFPVLCNMFPFAVYNLPRVLRNSPDDSNDWRKFRVHGGWAMGANSTGTDGGDRDSQPEYICDNVSNAADVWVPNNVNPFYFWLEIAASNASNYSARVLYGSAQNAMSYSDAASTPSNPWDHNSAPWSNVGAWTSAPVPDGSHIPIATVFCDPPNLRANVRQYLRTDVVTAPGTPCPYG